MENTLETTSGNVKFGSGGLEFRMLRFGVRISRWRTMDRNIPMVESANSFKARRGGCINLLIDNTVLTYNLHTQIYDSN